jgi:UDP-3-O-[3-hydroxymyristoyl] glucosamine N-acyltransferase
MAKTAKEIAQFLEGELVGNGSVLIKGINGIDEAGPGDIAFILKSEYKDRIGATKASCVVIPKDLEGKFDLTLIKVDKPSVAFSRIIELMMPDRIPHPKGIHPSAIVSNKALVGKNVSLGPYVVVEEKAAIGDGTVIYSFSYIGRNTKIGSNCVIYPNVTLREEIYVGSNVIIHPGAVIGSDGFGYDTLKDGSHIKIPQLGTVVIEDDVEIGACVTIDRARLSKTVIGKGSKIDNLVQIAHNVVIGPNCLIAAQTGISGSSELGRNVVLGGQVGVADHIKLGNFVAAGAQSGITKSYPDKTTLFWYPARPQDKIKKIIASIGLLPKLFERVRALESKIKELEK